MLSSSLKALRSVSNCAIGYQNLNTTIRNGSTASSIGIIIYDNTCNQTKLFKASNGCQLCSASTTASTAAYSSSRATRNGNLLKRVWEKVGFRPNLKTRLRVTGLLLYESVADNVDYLQFFNEFNMPNTFNSWFLVTELHIWMLLVRAMAEGSEAGENGRFLRNCIVESMWADVNVRAKKMGPQNISRTRQQIEELSEQFQAALLSYDEGMMSEDRVLAGAVWRRFFSMNCTDYRMIETLVKYIRFHISKLDHMSKEAFLDKPKIRWEPLDKINI